MMIGGKKNEENFIYNTLLKFSRCKYNGFSLCFRYCF